MLFKNENEWANSIRPLYFLDSRLCKGPIIFNDIRQDYRGGQKRVTELYFSTHIWGKSAPKSPQIEPLVKTAGLWKICVLRYGALTGVTHPSENLIFFNCSFVYFMWICTNAWLSHFFWFSLFLFFDSLIFLFIFHTVISLSSDLLVC